MSTNPNKIISLQELINAQVDAYKLEQIMNEAPWVEITTRLGRKCYSIATIQGIIDQYKIKVDTELAGLQEAIDTALAAGAGAAGWTDRLVQTWSGRTQEQKNKDNLSLYDFGYIADGTLHPLSEKYATLAAAQAVYPSATALTDSIDTVAVQKAIDYCNAQGKTIKVHVPGGTSIHNKEIVWKSYAYFEAANYHDTCFKKSAGFNGRLIVSENFDSITGTDASLTGLAIKNFGIVHIRLDGNYIQNDAYINNYGKGNLFIYGTKYKLNVKSVNTDGVGVWLEYRGSEDFVNDIVRDTYINLTIFDTAEEGLIFKGPQDIVISKVIQKSAGKITSADSRNYTLWSSKNYPDLGRIDGIVFDDGLELAMLHSFGNSVGYGVRLIKGRINADLVISESNLGGVDVYAPVYGMISKTQIHNIKGGVTYTEMPHESAGTFANLDNKSTAGLIIGDMRSDHSGSGQTGQNHVHFKGSQSSIGTLRINAYGKAGHGVYFDPGSSGNVVNNLIFNNAAGNSGFDGALTAAVVRNSNNAARQNFINSGQVVNCPVGLRAIGTNPRIEKINLMGLGVVTAFEGVKKSNPGQKWDFDIFDTSNTHKSTEFRASLPFDSSITTHQELVFTHNLIQVPQIKDIQISLVDTPTAISGSTSIQYMYVSDLNSEQIKVAVKLNVAHSVNTTPYISINAKV